MQNDFAEVFVQSSDVATTDDGVVIRATGGSEVSLATSRVAGLNPVLLFGATTRFVHCYKDDYTPIVNGLGSSTE